MKVLSASPAKRTFAFLVIDGLANPPATIGLRLRSIIGSGAKEVFTS